MFSMSLMAQGSCEGATRTGWALAETGWKSAEVGWEESVVGLPTSRGFNLEGAEVSLKTGSPRASLLNNFGAPGAWIGIVETAKGLPGDPAVLGGLKGTSGCGAFAGGAGFEGTSGCGTFTGGSEFEGILGGAFASVA